MEKLHKSLCLFFAFLACSLLPSSQAYKFYVGGSDGWVLKPKEPYTHWSGRNRFQVNDTLYFKYKKGEDSVLVVNDDDYFKCKIENPIMKMEGGDSEFKLDRSGAFYFITGNKNHCIKGQKLIVVVLALRKSMPFPFPTPPPPPIAQPPSPVALPPSPTPPPPIIPLVPSPESPTFSPTPTPTPIYVTPVPSTASPVVTPVPTMSPSAAAVTPAPAAMDTHTSAPSTTPVSGTPSDTAPAPPKSNSFAVTQSSTAVMVFVVTAVFMV